MNSLGFPNNLSAIGSIELSHQDSTPSSSSWHTPGCTLIGSIGREGIKENSRADFHRNRRRNRIQNSWRDPQDQCLDSTGIRWRRKEPSAYSMGWTKQSGSMRASSSSEKTPKKKSLDSMALLSLCGQQFRGCQSTLRYQSA